MRYNPKVPITKDPPLPVPLTGTVPQLPPTAKLDEDLSRLTKAIRALQGLDKYSDPVSDIAIVEAAIPVMGEWRLQWDAVNRPATAEEILGQVGALLLNFPLAGNIDPELRTRVLFEDLAVLHPTYYALDTACRALRNTCEFFKQPKLVEELRSADRQARRYCSILRQDKRELQGLLSYAKEGLEEQRRNSARIKKIIGDTKDVLGDWEDER